MRFLIDAQLPPAMVLWIKALGHQAEHVFDGQAPHTKDGAIWQRAVDGGMIIISKDEDFPVRRAMSASGPAIVWIRFGNCRNVELKRWLEANFEKICGALVSGETLIEVE